jgi:hypothetical protein
MRVDPGHDQGMHRSAHGRCTRSGAPPTTATFMQPLLSCFQLPNATQLSTPNRHTPHTVYPQQISTLTPSPAALRPKPHGTYLRLPPARAAAGHRAHPRTLQLHCGAYQSPSHPLQSLRPRGAAPACLTRPTPLKGDTYAPRYHRTRIPSRHQATRASPYRSHRATAAPTALERLQTPPPEPFRRTTAPVPHQTRWNLYP